MWASFPDVLNLIFAVFNSVNGQRLAKYVKLNPPRNIRHIRYDFSFSDIYGMISCSQTLPSVRL